MASATGSLKRVYSCPLLVILAAVFGFLYSYIDNVNPLPGILMGFFGLGGDFLGTVITAISVVLSARVLLKGLVILVVLILVGALIMGLFMSGYMNLMKNVVLRGRNDSKLFVDGVSRDFGKAYKGSFFLILCSVLLGLVVIISAIPALSTTWAALHGKYEILPLAIFLLLLTLLAVFFILLSYNVYTAFWFPAIAMGHRRFITASKSALNEYFFNVAGSILRYTIEIILITLISMLIRYFFSGFIQSMPGFTLMLILEGLAVTYWFLHMTNYITYSFAQLSAD